MSCAACSARVEKAVSAVTGVTECSVSLLSGTMTVHGTATDEQIVNAVIKAGYGARPKVSGLSESTENTKNKDLRLLVFRLLISLALLLALSYISMGRMMLSLPLPGGFADNAAAIALAQLLLCTAVMVINNRFFISGSKAFFHLAPNMDTLVALGSFSAFAYSVYGVFVIFSQDNEAAMMTLDTLHFEAAAMILVLITVGKTLESRAKGKTVSALSALIELSPRMATVIVDGKEIDVPVSKVKAGDIFSVKAGQSVPVDGTVIEGVGVIDESALTGESVPAEKNVDSKVYAATVNRSGYIKCRASTVGEDTVFARVCRLVQDAQASKAPIARLADKVAAVFVPFVLAVALVTFAAWLISGQTLGFAVARAVSVLVISCPCSLGLATPVAITVASGVGAKNGILFRTASAIEATGKIQTVAFDKTGTLTLGRPAVTDVLPITGAMEELLTLAVSLEKRSEHPLAFAVTEYAEQNGVKAKDVEDFETSVGMGIEASLEMNGILGKGYAGSLSYVSDVCDIPPSVTEKLEHLACEGKTPMLFAFSGELKGIIAVSDEIRRDARYAVSELKRMGIGTVMLTGDNSRTAQAVAKEVGIDNVRAELLPDGKLEAINKLKKDGKVMMIGDGVNDAPALAAADVGAAVGVGTDIARESADLVLMKNGMTDALNAVKLARKTLVNVKENLFWAFFYNLLGIPVAAGALYYGFGILLSPMIGAAAMSLSSICVVMNALRLSLVTFATETDLINEKEKEDMLFGKKKENEIELKIEGMMCPHCEARVKNALLAVDGVADAAVSHKKGNAVVTLSKEVPLEALTEAVKAQGYTVK